MFGLRRYEKLLEIGAKRYETLLDAGEKRYETVLEAGAKRHEAVLEQSERRYQEQLQITREVIRRNELAFTEGSRVMADLAQSVRELREDVRANTQATLKLLDRFENGGEAATS